MRTLAPATQTDPEDICERQSCLKARTQVPSERKFSTELLHGTWKQNQEGEIGSVFRNNSHEDGGDRNFDIS